MQNIDLSLNNDDILTLTIDLKQEHGLSTGGNSVRVACSQGNVELWQDGKPHPKRIKLNVNIFRALTEEERDQLGLAPSRRRSW